MVGPLMLLTLLVLVGAIALFALDHFNKDEKARTWGWRLFHGAVVLQAAVLLGLCAAVLAWRGVAARLREYR